MKTRAEIGVLLLRLKQTRYSENKLDELYSELSSIINFFRKEKKIPEVEIRLLEIGLQKISLTTVDGTNYYQILLESIENLLIM